MSRKNEAMVQLRVGEEVEITSRGTVELELVSGVLELAGQVLLPEKPYVCYPQGGTFITSVVVYTLEGGSMMVKGEHNFSIQRGATGVGELHRLVYRSLHSSEPFRAVVIGRPGSGKSFAAATLIHLLHRLREERGLVRRTFLIDLNASSNVLFAPGCVSSREIVPQHPLLPGMTNHPEQPYPSLNFFTSVSHRPRSLEEGLCCVHFAEQCVQTTVGWAEELIMAAKASQESETGDSPQLNRAEILAQYGIIVDLPSPVGALPAVQFFRQVLQAIQPTHVIIVTDEVPPGSGDLDDDENDSDQEAPPGTTQDADNENEEISAHQSSSLADRFSSMSFTPRWIAVLLQDIQRILPDCNCIRILPVLNSRNEKNGPRSEEESALVKVSAQLLLRKYFTGGHPYPSLGCSKVVLPTTAVQFVELRYNPDLLGVSAYPVEASILQDLVGHSKSTFEDGFAEKDGVGEKRRAAVGGLVCSLSHAEVIEEVPLAPSAGLFVMTHFDESSKEMTWIIPASRTEPLVRQFVVLPCLETDMAGLARASTHLERDKGLCLAAVDLAYLEEFSVAS